MTLSFARRILVVGPGLEALAKEAFPGAHLDVGGAERLQSRWTFGETPDLVLIDAAATTPLDLTAAIGALGRAASPPPAILAGEIMPAALVRALMKLPHSDVLEAPFAAADLAEAARGLLAPKDATPHVTATHCWTVTGAVGGAGATMLSIETACALAERKGGRVCLVDLNLADGAAAAYLGAPANMVLSRAAQSPDRIDAAMLEAFASTAPGGFDLLASPRDPNAFANTPSEVIIRMLDVACQVYDFVVVDVPRHRHAWTLDVLAGSDELLVVSELTVPALLAARSLAGELEADLGNGPPPRIVLNRLAKRVFGPAPSMGEAEKALGRKADGGITSDWEAAAASANLGGPIRQHRPKSRIVKDVEELVDRLLAQPSVRAADSQAAA
jgi:pilus assembly protein CpaE